MSELEQIRAQLFALHRQVAALLDDVSRLIAREEEPEQDTRPDWVREDERERGVEP